jgi:hypothetical protein
MEVVVSLGKDPVTGKYEQKRVTVKGSMQDAQRKLRELLLQVENGMYADPGKMTVAEYLNG